MKRQKISIFTNILINPNTVYPELINPITTEEIINAIESRKLNTAYGCDNLLNDYFISTFVFYQTIRERYITQ